MSQRRLLAIFGVFALIVIGFGLVRASLPSTITVPGAAQPAGGSVEWQDYAAVVRSRIDGFAASKDCTGLQAEFDTADANNAATMNRVGHNNAKLMAYIDDRMLAAGCY